MTVPVQEFQIGQRVRFNGRPPFVIMVVSFDGDRFYYGEGVELDTWHFSSDLTLCPERPPYVPSERRVMYRDGGPPTFCEFLNEHYRCETDAGLAARHAAERHAAEQAAYEAQGEGE